MPASPIRKLTPYAEAAKEKGIKVYHLNIGQPDIRTPEVALDALRNLKSKIIEYSPSAGNESYRKKLASYYQSHNIDIDYKQILVTAGGSEAIQIALLSTMNPGDEVIIPEPFYANYNSFAHSANVKILPVISDIEHDFALPPVEEFEKLIGPRTKGIMICNPNNPTGYLYSRQEIEALGEIVRKHNIYLFADEVYREFCYDGRKHFSAMRLKNLDDNVVLVDSVSKRYSACGVRIGALISRNKELINTALKFAQARLSPPSLGQILSEAAIETPKEYFEEVYNEYIDRRNFTIETLNKIEGVMSPLPGGAFYTIAKLPVDDAEDFSRWLLSDFEHNNETVMLAPASGFYSSPGAGKNQVRIAYVLKKEDLKNALECLKEGLMAYKLQ